MTEKLFKKIEAQVDPETTTNQKKKKKKETIFDVL